jgi:CO dehydrogenase/acetyl-CoA synthase alpha subunit
MSNVIFSQNLYDTAQNIVDGCMGDADPACQTACPMHTDVKGYVKLAGEGDYKGALHLIRERLFLPQTLGRICAHPCEANCRRNTEFNQPISVAGKSPLLVLALLEHKQQSNFVVKVTKS